VHAAGSSAIATVSHRSPPKRYLRRVAKDHSPRDCAVMESLAVMRRAATSLVNAQSATPIEGNPSAARPAPPVSGTLVMPASPSTTGAAPNSAAPKSEGAAHMPGGNPDRAPGSTQTHEPPAR
jgi:hypothetical protein